VILSICIPNYNRPKSLNNCLNSIHIASKNTKFEFEICISDNCSDSNIKKIIKPYEKILNIKFNKKTSSKKYRYRSSSKRKKKLQ